MNVSVIRCVFCWVLALAVPLSSMGQAPSAIVHTQGGVWVNGSEARDSTAVFTGDLIQTKPGFSATLTLEGSTVLIQAESVAKLESDLLSLDHGAVSVTTSTAFKVRVNCLTVVPISNEWNQYDVADVNGSIDVAARKSDVNVDHEKNRGKPSPAHTGARDGSVHQGEQHSYSESDLCGAPARTTGTGSALNPKLIAGGATGTGILLWLLLHGGSNPPQPLSSTQP